MQFTPKKKRTLTGYRYNPYTSTKSIYLGQYKQNIEKITQSTPKKKIFNSVTPLSCKRSLTPRLKSCATLTDDKIKLELLESNFVTIDNNSEESVNDVLEDEVDPLLLLPIIVPKETYSAAKQKKSVLLQSNDDIFAISDEEFDKENFKSNFSTNSFYKKESTPKRSSVLCDISPTTVKNINAHESLIVNNGKPPLKFKFQKIDTKNEPVKYEFPHMIGFPNNGNTCYLNCVMQSLLGILPFIIDLFNAQIQINLSNKSITSSLCELISGRQKCNDLVVRKALKYVKENIERVDEAFAGCKMQDANEFLTQVLDNIKDEISLATGAPWYSNQIETTPIKENANWEKYADKGCNSLMRDDTCSGSFSIHNTDITNVTGPTLSDQTTIINPVVQNFGFELLETCKCLGCGEIALKTQEHFALYVNLPKEDETLNIQRSVEAYMSEDQREVRCEKCGHSVASVVTGFTKLPRILIVQLKRYEYHQEQYECIKVNAKVDLNVWLYLGNLTATAVETAPPWTLQQLVISSDSSETEPIPNYVVVASQSDAEIKTNSVTSTVDEETIQTTEPDIDEMPLINLNDSLYEKEEEEFQLAIKLSLQESRVCYSTDETSDEASSEEAFSEDDEHAYRLLSVISHFGQTTTTGHYVADVLNCQESQWYHYDDETVAKLQEAVLLAEGRQKNAYIYFYVDKNLFEELSKETPS